MNRKEWNKAHSACPNCGNESLLETFVGVIEIDDEYEDNVNSAECPICGWSGKVKDLNPKINYENGSTSTLIKSKLSNWI